MLHLLPSSGNKFERLVVGGTLAPGGRDP